MNALSELRNLLDLFGDDERLIERAEHIASALTPEPYKQLLVHDHHMTVTMEAYHKCTVNVRVLAQRQEGNYYCRKILLERSDTGKVVQYGIVRLDFSYVTERVRDEILGGQIPLGRVLIQHNVLRHIDLGAILRISPGVELQQIFGSGPQEVTYGRLATIFCNQQPAVDLLEISTPLGLVE